MASPESEHRKLNRVLGEITRVIEAGERIDTQVYLEHYPQLAPELKQFFADEGVQADGHTREPDDELAPGTAVDDYRILGVIGRGGMGVVYEARQVPLDRIVALKVLPPGALHSGKSIDRFRREAQAVARLSHPRIVAVHGFRQSDGLAYLAMERVRGHDLGKIIDRLRVARTHGRRFVRISGTRLEDEDDLGSWAAGRKLVGTMPGDSDQSEGIIIDLRNYAHMAAAVAADAADALRHAHAHGVIHRDIKPSNLIMGSDGRIKLSDFGLAKDVAEGSLTNTGDFVGSPQYVSPEQAGSRRVKIDERSDIYSLGVTLYEFLTLHMPFTGPNVAVILRQIISKDPPPPTRLNPRIPKDLETIVGKAIEKDPDKRYQSAEEFGDDLRRFLNFESISARPPGPVARVVRTLQHNRSRAAAVTLGVLALVLAFVLLFDRRAGSDAIDSVARQLAARSGDDFSAQGAVELVGQLHLEMAPAERRARLDAIYDEADQLLDKGDFEGVTRLLERLQTRLALDVLDDLDRQLIERKMASVRVDLLRRIHHELMSAGHGGALAEGSARLGGGASSEALGDRARRALLRLVERRLRDRDLRVLRSAAMILGSQGNVSSLGALLDALDLRHESGGRLVLIDALGRLGDPAAEGALAELTHDPEPSVRYAALEALERLAPERLPSLIAHLERDDERWVRYRAQLALVRRPAR